MTEDGYLGDCSSDGGNEKNFPMPNYKVKRLQLINSYRLTATNGESSAGSGSEFAMESPAAGGEAAVASTSASSSTGGRGAAAASSSDFQVEPPAGINFQNLQPDFVSSCGYQVKKKVFSSSV